MRLVKMIWWWINKGDYHMGDTVTFTYQQGCLGMGCGEEHFAM